MRQIPLAIATPGATTFDSFLGTVDTAPVLDHLLQQSSTPIYLWGPSGSGKTHLLRALALRHHAHGEPVGWFDASTPLPWTPDPAWPLFILDECERFDAAQQQAAFSLFVEAFTAGTALAAAGRLPPVDLPLRDDLRTRLGWGHVFALTALPEPQARAVLRREADHRTLFLSDEVLDYLLTRFERNLKHLMALLERLDGYAWEQKRAQVTIPMLKQMLAADAGERPPP